MIGWLSKASHDQTANQRPSMPLVVFTPSTPDDITRNYLLSGHAPSQRGGVAAAGQGSGVGTGLDWTALRHMDSRPRDLKTPGRVSCVVGGVLMPVIFSTLAP